MVNKLADIISQKIQKNAQREYGSTQQKDMELEDVELIIDGKKIKCKVWINVEYTPIYAIDSDDLREFKTLEDIDYTILEMGIVETEDGTIYTEEQEKTILKDNQQLLDEDIYDKLYSWEEF